MSIWQLTMHLFVFLISFYANKRSWCFRVTIKDKLFMKGLPRNNIIKQKSLIWRITCKRKLFNVVYLRDEAKRRGSFMIKGKRHSENLWKHHGTGNFSCRHGKGARESWSDKALGFAWIENTRMERKTLHSLYTWFKFPSSRCMEMLLCISSGGSFDHSLFL